MKQIVIAGALGKDAVLRRTQAGEPVLGFTVAVDDGYGENKSTMWFDVNVWGKRGQSLEPHLKKGTRVTVAGELGARQHEAKTYFTCRASDVAIQGGGDRSASHSREQERDSYGNNVGSAPANFSRDLDDDIPF
jgi:single-strand DNA-binding protein